MSVSFEDALKAKQLREFFYEKGRIYIAVDTTVGDVNVPDFLQGDPTLRLVLNTRMPQPIYIRDGFVESNFSFSGVKHHCVIPMNRIWAAYVPEQAFTSGLVWEDCMPETVKMVLAAVEDIGENDKVKPEVQLVSATDKGEENHAKRSARKKAGHLRVVK